MSAYTDYLTSVLGYVGARVRPDGIIAMQTPDGVNRKDVPDVSYKGKEFFIQSEAYNSTYRTKPDNHVSFNIFNENSLLGGVSEDLDFLKSLAEHELNVRIIMLFGTVGMISRGANKSKYIETTAFVHDLLEASGVGKAKKENELNFLGHIKKPGNVKLVVRRNHMVNNVRHAAFASLVFPFYDQLKPQVNNLTDPLIGTTSVPLDASKLYVAMIEYLFPSVVESKCVGVTSINTDFAPRAQTFLRLIETFDQCTGKLCSASESTAYGYIDRNWLKLNGQQKQFAAIAKMLPNGTESVKEEVEPVVIAQPQQAQQQPTQQQPTQQQTIQQAPLQQQAAAQQPQPEAKKFVFGECNNALPAVTKVETNPFQIQGMNGNSTSQIKGKMINPKDNLYWYVDHNNNFLRPVDETAYMMMQQNQRFAQQQNVNAMGMQQPHAQQQQQYVQINGQVYPAVLVHGQLCPIVNGQVVMPNQGNNNMGFNQPINNFNNMGSGIGINTGIGSGFGNGLGSVTGGINLI